MCNCNNEKCLRDGCATCCYCGSELLNVDNTGVISNIGAASNRQYEVITSSDFYFDKLTNLQEADQYSVSNGTGLPTSGDMVYNPRTVHPLEKENEVLKKRVAELELQLKEGTEDGSRCNRRCEGVMVLGLPENCSCHLRSPCGPCEDNRPVCSMCGEEVE